MKALKNIMLSCKKATELMEKKTILKLSLKETVQLHMHISVCKACKSYQKQMKRLDAIFQKFFTKGSGENIPMIENIELKERILSDL